ncbi:MAG: NrfD/PsrC family molybdoenzyme membrane anchor subunit, partial [Chloroflexota bacterium]
LGRLPATPLFTTVASFLSLFFVAVTTGLLVWDLEKPERFLTILTRPQWRSWLARGAFILIGFSAVVSLFFLGYLLRAERLAQVLIWPGAILGVLSAVYTAFLFAQAEGRDLWQSPLLPWHLLVQSVMAGAAGLFIAGLFTGLPAVATRSLVWTFGLSILANLFITVAGEFGIPHASQVAATAARMITHGRYQGYYRFSLAAGLLLPLLLVVLAPTSPMALAAAGGLSLTGLFAYEWVFVMAPQQAPNN